MRTHVYYAVLERVYQHFVIDQNPPAMIDGYIRYHHGKPGDSVSIDCPCAIGLLDDGFELHNSPLARLDVVEPYEARPELVASFLDIDDINYDDVEFLSQIHIKHDWHAAEAYRKPWRLLDTFRSELADAFEGIAREYDLPGLAF